MDFQLKDLKPGESQEFQIPINSIGQEFVLSWACSECTRRYKASVPMKLMTSGEVKMDICCPICDGPWMTKWFRKFLYKFKG